MPDSMHAVESNTIFIKIWDFMLLHTYSERARVPACLSVCLSVCVPVCFVLIDLPFYSITFTCCFSNCEGNDSFGCLLDINHALLRGQLSPAVAYQYLSNHDQSLLPPELVATMPIPLESRQASNSMRVSISLLPASSCREVI